MTIASALSSAAFLPISKTGPPAPGGSSGTPPQVDIPTLPPQLPVIIIRPAWQPPQCKTPWSHPHDVPTDGSYVRLQDDIWVRWDSSLDGWVHWFGVDSGEYMRDTSGIWYSLSDTGVKTRLPNIDDRQFFRP